MKARHGILRVRAGAGVAAEVMRYGLVVSCGYLLAIGLYSAALDLGVPAYPALGIVFVLNGLFNFSLLRIWAFPPSGRSVGSDLRRFCVVAAASLIVNYASFAVLFTAVGLPATTAQRLAILIAAPVSFLANRLWSFQRGTPNGGAVARGARAERWPLSARNARRRPADHVPDDAHEREIGHRDECHGSQALPAALTMVDRARPPRSQHQ
jgi:putative flippase GtrA